MKELFSGIGEVLGINMGQLVLVLHVYNIKGCH